MAFLTTREDLATRASTEYREEHGVPIASDEERFLERSRTRADVVEEYVASG